MYGNSPTSDVSRRSAKINSDFVSARTTVRADTTGCDARASRCVSALSIQRVLLALARL
jgi:hypothetical protein